MASASDAVYVSTPTLLQNFVRAHGVGGLLRQGVMPEIARATTMRVVQFFSYPLVHEVRKLPRPYPQTLACVQTTLTGARTLEYLPRYRRRSSRPSHPRARP